MKPKPMEAYRENQGPESSTTTAGAVDRVLKAAAAVTDLGQQASRMTTAAGDAMSAALEDGKVAARRAVKRGYNRAEDLIDEASYRVKRSPLQSVGIGFGAGLLIGAIVTRLLRR